jgi:hypothetical protein
LHAHLSQARPASGVPVASAPPQVPQMAPSAATAALPPAGFQMWIVPVGQEHFFPAQCPCCHYTGRLRVRKVRDRHDILIRNMQQL